MPRQYETVVYYTRVAITDDSPYWSFGRSTVIQQWADAEHHVDRLHIDGLATPIDRVRRGGRTYPINAATRALFAAPTIEQWIESLVRQSCATDAAGTPVQMAIGSGYVATMRCAQHRIAPGTLPAGFFDPPQTGQSLWDRLSGWLHGHTKRLSAGVPKSP